MSLASVPPALLLILGAVLLPVIAPRWRLLVLLGLPLASLAQIWHLPDGVVLSGEFLGFAVAPLQVDALSRVFGTVFSITTFAGALFAYRHASLLEMCSALLYAGAALGVVFAGDLLSVFVYWELMAIGSTLVLWSAGTARAWRASLRYLLVHLFGGVVLMIGVTGWAVADGDLSFRAMSAALDGGGVRAFAAAFILAGFLLNAGAPPLSAWVADAYPEASPSGAVFLSAFTTKTAVYVLIRGFPGAEILIGVGLFMVFYGIVYALLENDIRRILVYSIVNQVGFMVTAVGIGTELALNGAAAHAFAHIIYKALLLMSAGSVLLMTGKRNCTELGGLVQSMPLTAVCGVIGALSIASFPLTSGFVSKSMIVDAAAHEHLALVWSLLAAASAGAFLYVGLKYPWFVFFDRDCGLRPPDPPLLMSAAMVMLAALCIGLGVAPGLLYAMLPHTVDYVPYTSAHVVSQLQLLLFAGLAFFALLPRLRPTLTITLDVDWFYRRFPDLVLAAVAPPARLLWRALGESVRGRLMRAGRYFARCYGAREGIARVTGSGSMAIAALGVFGGVLLYFFLR
jgi:multicomponent Na+:H+ antiporter subunit D